MCCKCSTGRSNRRGCTLYSRYIALMYTVQFMSGISVLYALLEEQEDGLYSRYIVNLHCTVYVWDTCAVHALLAGVVGGVVQ